MIQEIISYSQFNEINKNKVLVYCYANWDPSCQVLDSVIKHLSQNYNILKVNIDNYNLTFLIEELNIRSIPSFIFFEDGIEKERGEGNLSFKDLKEMLN
jgi:thiol-disulfide isomerase/thioredoxin